jgi:hypothetical protein
MGELEKLAAQVAKAIHEYVSPPEFHPGKVSVWIKLVRPQLMDGAHVEETLGSVHKVIFDAISLDELIREVADNLVLAAFGGDVQIVTAMPNLIVKLFETKGYVPIPGAPPIDQAGQVYLKATVYRWEPSLWDQLFKRQQPGD